jgi:hypothetical protein
MMLQATSGHLFPFKRARLYRLRFAEGLLLLQGGKESAKSVFGGRGVLFEKINDPLSKTRDTPGPAARGTSKQALSDGNASEAMAMKPAPLRPRYRLPSRRGMSTIAPWNFFNGSSKGAAREAP